MKVCLIFPTAFLMGPCESLSPPLGIFLLSHALNSKGIDTDLLIPRINSQTALADHNK